MECVSLVVLCFYLHRFYLVFLWLLYLWFAKVLEFVNWCFSHTIFGDSFSSANFLPQLIFVLFCFFSFFFLFGIAMTYTLYCIVNSTKNKALLFISPFFLVFFTWLLMFSWSLILSYSFLNLCKKLNVPVYLFQFSAMAFLFGMRQEDRFYFTIESLCPYTPCNKNLPP